MEMASLYFRVSVSTFKCLTATACLPMSPIPLPPPSNKAFLKEKLNAAIVIVIVVKTYKIQGRKPGGKVKQKVVLSVRPRFKIQNEEITLKLDLPNA